MPRTDINLTLAQFLIIAAIGTGRLHGPAIVASYEVLTDGQRTITQGALYTTLQRMEDQGLLVSISTGARAKNPADRRRYFEVTRRGRSAFERSAAILGKVLAAVPPKLR